MKHRLPVVLLLLLAATASPSAALAQALFFNDATVYTMGPQGTLQRADVLVRDGRIKDVAAQLPVPSDATVIEADGRPLTPGFFAGTTELGLVEVPVQQVPPTVMPAPVLRPELDVSVAFDPFEAAIPVTRIEGYTWTVLSASQPASVVGGQGRAVSLGGEYSAFIGPRILFLGLGVYAMDQGAGTVPMQWMILEQAMAEAALPPTEVVPTGGMLGPLGRRALAAFVGAGLVVFQVDRASDILQVMDFASRHNLRPVISGGAEAWMVADRLAEAGVPVLLNALENLPGSFDQLGARLDNAAILHSAGVTISFADGETHNARKLRQLAGNAVAHGLPWEAGLAAMTVNPASIFELGQDRGTLQADSRADLVLWSGDPLEVTSAADAVVIDGRPIEMVSRQTLLRDRYLLQNPTMPRAYIKP